MKTDTLKVIKSAKDHKAALARIDDLVIELETTGKGLQELEVLGLLVSSYEDSKFPLKNPHPIEAIKFMMEQHGVNTVGLGKLIGSKSRASEILNLKRRLSMEMMKVIHAELHVPYEVLMQPYELQDNQRSASRPKAYKWKAKMGFASPIQEMKMPYSKKANSGKKKVGQQKKKHTRP